MKHKKRKHSRKEESSSSASSSESSSDESPPRHKSKQHKRSENRKDYEKHSKRTSPQKHSRRRDDSSDEERMRSKKIEKERNERSRESSRRSRDYKKDKHGREKKHHTTSPLNIKKEEDFDRRQEQLRRRREQEREAVQRPTNVRIKQEPDEQGRRNDRRSHGERRQQRDQDEQERRRNDERRAKEWERREREGGNAQALAPEPPKEKEKPNLGLSGALTEDTNTFRGVVIKYNEPPEAWVPKKKWRLYPFKGDEALKVLHLHRQSAYLLGRVRRIADIPIDHPSCSKQHAVLQFRLVEEQKEDGTTRKITKPYIIDLESANGTFVNNQQIEARRYVELKEQDVIKFGFSSREYVLIHDKSDTTQVKDSDKSEEDSDE